MLHLYQYFLIEYKKNGGKLSRNPSALKEGLIIR